MKPKERRLAAVMFTDIVGYSSMMQKNEEIANRLRVRHREVFQRLHERFGGKILQYFGDGTLSVFSSTTAAVECAVALQQALKKDPPVPIRIGIHTGDITFSEEETYGDGVNVASRIESLAAAGSVFISEKIYDEVKNQPDIKTTSLGAFEFKNVDKPLEVFAVTNTGLVVPAKDQLTGKLKTVADPARKKSGLAWLFLPLAVLIAGWLIYRMNITQPTVTGIEVMPEKSIAVLPFINDSNDSSNVYIINGLMESILNNLQQIGDLRVISRTSVEQYRNTTRRIPELAEELGVNYFVEGSGQKIGDELLLNIQLIEAHSDRHVWSAQYRRETTDIFGLQLEVAQKIAGEIQAIITPEEAERLERTPTKNLEAYDAFLKGRELFYRGDRESLLQGIALYEEAIALDPEFARAYAGLAIAYYFLDYNQTEKQYAQLVNSNADKALLYDPQSPQSLVAKSLFYIQNGEYDAALPHLEKALEYNPNSDLVINILSDFYTRYVPNSEKYLEYALKGIKLDIAGKDSSTASFIYLHLANAFIQNGFEEEAEKYINRSLEYNPDNLYSAYVKAFILYAKNRDLVLTKTQLLHLLSRDSTNLDVLQEVGKICYFMRDYEAAYRYYKNFNEIREALNLDIYPTENAKIATVMRYAGYPEEADRFMSDFKTYTANDQSIYKSLNEAMISAYEGDTQKALEQVRAFSEMDHYHYWILLFLKIDPLMDQLKEQPPFQKIMQDMETKFQAQHERIKKTLTEQHLLVADPNL
ncbi:MAG: hypothetical protein KDD15_25015 [Lewinella sp.]|nr:hypothetical protein [Lewinella sp.]